MKRLIRMVWVLVSAFALCLTSCLNEAADPNSNEGQLPSNVAELVDQVEAMKSTVSEVESVLATLSGNTQFEGEASELEACVTAVNEHVASVEAGLSGVNAAVAALELQGQLAKATGALKAQIELYSKNAKLSAAVASVEKSAAAWLGKDFKNYFVVSAEQARLESMLSVVESQSITADALSSDVEAGLRVGDASELKDVLSSVKNSSETLSKLNQKMTTLCSEVEQGYANAIKSEGPDTKNTLKALNTKAAATVEESTVTLSDLVARISACEATLEDLNDRLVKVETDVEALLGMIQSVSFLSDYSSDYAVAYYEMKNTKVSAPGKAYDGKNQRDAAGTIQLSYMVRPASAAAVVTSDVVSVVGYYANQIQTKAVDPSQFVNFAVQGVQLTNAERGIVTVTLSHDLKDDFYYKATGAKCALFIATGKTDISSKFVELVPKDNSTTVYVEGIKINTDDFEIDEGQSKTLTATVNPSSATNKTVTWTSSNTEIATIDQYSGKLTAVKQGNVTITATTNGIDEWGDKLTASVNVKVNPSIRLGGPLYVEEGKTAELSLDFPPAMNIESKVWLSSDETKATVENGIVTGVAHTYNQYTYQYNPITITCIVNGNITLTHEMSVVVPQPRQIKLNNYGDDVKSVSMKLDQTISLAGSILPANVDASLFRMTYESDGGLGWINFDNGEIKAPGSVGGRYVYIKVKDIDKHTYMKTFVERTVVVNVEPYYVESITLPATMNLAPGATATLTPSFTSDVDGKQPTNTSLTWTSSNPSIVSVDSKTGEMTANAEGTVTITATTSEGAASGSAIKTATCMVTVKTPVAEVKVGDYYYSDGTWGSSANPSGKTVIGVIFSNANAVAADPILAKDYPKCSNGLVIGLRESESAFGNYRIDGAYSNSLYDGNFGISPYGAVLSDTAPTGYGLTLAYGNYRNNIKSSSGYEDSCILFDVNSGVAATFNQQTPTPSSASSWYIPSKFEMDALYENMATINSKLTSVGGTQIGAVRYWSSYVYSKKLHGAGNYHDCYAYPIDMSNGGWITNAANTTSYKVRVVLAF